MSELSDLILMCNSFITLVQSSYKLKKKDYVTIIYGFDYNSETRELNKEVYIVAGIDTRINGAIQNKQIKWQDFNIYMMHIFKQAESSAGCIAFGSKGHENLIYFDSTIGENKRGENERSYSIVFKSRDSSSVIHEKFNLSYSNGTFTLNYVEKTLRGNTTINKEFSFFPLMEISKLIHM